jgi:hypothetical protein
MTFHFYDLRNPTYWAHLIHIYLLTDSYTMHNIFISINFRLLCWSQWCPSSHVIYDKSHVANTAQPAALHVCLTAKAVNKYFWQEQHIIPKTCTCHNCGRLAAIHAKHNVKTSTTNSVTHHNQLQTPADCRTSREKSSTEPVGTSLPTI